MKSSTNDAFWKFYYNLPLNIRKHARRVYILFEKDTYHPSLNFKRIHSTRPIYSVRINRDYRAVGIVEGDEITWFWIGSHADYDRLIKRLRII